mgnify:FL=1|jgi:hypothetical protein
MTFYTTHFSAALIAASAVLLSATGCQRERTATVRVNCAVEWNGEPFTIGESGLDMQGREAQLERLEAYVSDFALHDVEEGWIDIDTVARLDFSLADSHALLEVVGTGDRSIDGIRMGLGVPADRNKDVDPASYDNPDHPLGFKGSAGMHWGWAAGYIFSVYEGRLLTEPNVPFAYHAGNDTCFRTVELMFDAPRLLECESTDLEINLVLDAYQCLHGDGDVIDPELDPETHTGNNLPLALRWVDLYQSAWSIAP